MAQQMNDLLESLGIKVEEAPTRRKSGGGSQEVEIAEADRRRARGERYLSAITLARLAEAKAEDRRKRQR